MGPYVGFVRFPPRLFWSISRCLGEAIELPQNKADNRTGACVLIANRSSEIPLYILQAGEIKEDKYLKYLVMAFAKTAYLWNSPKDKLSGSNLELQESNRLRAFNMDIPNGAIRANDETIISCSGFSASTDAAVSTCIALMMEYIDIPNACILARKGFVNEFDLLREKLGL
mgnify:CR=1 FL=1